MLSRSLLSLQRMFSTTARAYVSGVPSFNRVSDLNNHLEQQKATFTVVYFRAGWNPECAQADRDVARLQRQYPQVKVVAVDSDQSLELKRYYDIKYEPELVLCLYGDEVTRHVGVNYDNLRNRLERVMKLPETLDFEGLTQWLPYGSLGNVHYDFYLRECLRWARQ